MKKGDGLTVPRRVMGDRGRQSHLPIRSTALRALARIVPLRGT
jgi:hypothetical protein